MDVNGGDVPTLGLRLTLDGVDKAVADMGKVGDAGDATAKRVENAGKDGGSKFQQAFQQNLGKSLADAKTFGDMLTTQFDADMARIREGQARGFIDPAAARKAGVEAGIAYNTGVLSQLDRLGAAGANVGNSSAYADLASSLKNIGGAGDSAFTGIGRVRQGLSSLVAQATGTSPVLDRVTSSFLGMGIGSVAVIGVLAGAYAITEVYKAWTESATKASEEQKKLTDALTQWYDKQKEGPAGDIPKQIDAMTKSLGDLQKKLDELKNDSPQGIFDAIGAGGSKLLAFVRVLTAGDAAAVARQLGIEVAKGGTNLATQANHDTDAIAAARVEAAKRINDAEVQANRETMQAILAANAKRIISDNTVVESLVKQGAAYQSASQMSNDLAVAAANDARLAAVQGEAHDLLALRIKAENEQRAANLKYANDPTALGVATQAIQAAYDQEKATMLAAQATQHQADAQKNLNTVLEKGIPAAAAEANAAIAAQNQKRAAEQKYQDDLHNIWAHGIDRIVTDGTKSFHDFFEDVLELFQDLFKRMEKEGQGGSLAAGALRLGSAGIVGGIAGYQTGQQLGGGLNSALGGAASGALAGAAFGPWGAAIGGVVGLTTGLLGGAAAAKQRKEAEDALRASIEDSTLALKVQAGTASSVAQQIAQINDAAKKNHDDIDKAYAGLKNQPQRESLFASNETDRLDAITKLSTDFWSGIQQQLNALNGPAGDLANQLATLKAAYDANELSAHDLGASTAQLAEIQDLYDQSVAAAQKAYADAVAAQKKANDDVTASLAVRNAKALGQNDLADTLQQQIDQASELYDEQQKGLDAATIAAQQYTDALEQSALVAAQAEAALQRLISGIKQDQGVYGYTDQQALDKEAAAYGFGGLSRDQVLAKYVAHDHDLSAADQSLDNEITQYLADYNKVHGAVTGAIAAVASAAQSNAVTSQVQSDIAGISESTGSREADFLQSIDVHVRSLDTYITGNHGGVGVTFRGASGAILPGANSQSAVQSQSFSGATINFTMTGNVYLQDGSQVPQAKNALVAAMNQGLGNKTRRDKLATGNADRSS